eukprot:snap_masked-scaffold_9-processed-gene-9.31-mRNA-1 protein AED:1.00 eAED:1.00 QI:0/0/0/0/1/1/3/0/61
MKITPYQKWYMLKMTLIIVLWSYLAVYQTPGASLWEKPSLDGSKVLTIQTETTGKKLLRKI